MRTTRVAAVTAALAVALGTLVTAANASDHGVRMNEIQLLGSHNSYHRELSFTEKKLQRESDNLWYSHASLPVQFEQESVRQIEIDVIPDSDQGGLYTDPFIRKQAGLGPLTDPELAKPGIKVMHVADYDYNATCSTLVRCLQQVKGWSDTHPDHAPIPILIELKKTDPTLEKLGGVKSPPWDAKQFDRLDNEIRSVLGDEHLITPDTIRHLGLTLDPDNPFVTRNESVHGAEPLAGCGVPEAAHLFACRSCRLLGRPAHPAAIASSAEPDAAAGERGAARPGARAGSWHASLWRAEVVHHWSALLWWVAVGG